MRPGPHLCCQCHRRLSWHRERQQSTLRLQQDYVAWPCFICSKRVKWMSVLSEHLLVWCIAFTCISKCTKRGRHYNMKSYTEQDTNTYFQIFTCVGLFPKANYNKNWYCASSCLRSDWACGIPQEDIELSRSWENYVRTIFLFADQWWQTFSIRT